MSIVPRRERAQLIREGKAHAARVSMLFVDALNRRDRLRADIRQRPPRWWRDLEERGDVQPWTVRVLDWQRRLETIERLIDLYESELTTIETTLADLLAREAEADKREAHDEAVAMRGRKNGYAQRLRPNFKPPVKQLGLGW